MAEIQREAVSILHECRDVCLETFAIHCVKIGGKHMAREHIRRMVACIEICGITGDFLLRHSPMARELCELCADVCKECAASCAALGDLRMNGCVRACERSVRACLNESHYLGSVAA